jgi:hypothetical protein
VTIEFVLSTFKPRFHAEFSCYRLKHRQEKNKKEQRTKAREPSKGPMLIVLTIIRKSMQLKR